MTGSSTSSAPKPATPAVGRESGGRRRPVVLIGPYPAWGGAIGGISVHIQRLRAQLRARGFDVWVYQVGGHGCPGEQVYGLRREAGCLKPMLGRERQSLIHSHAISARVRVAQGWLRRVRSGPLLLTVHGHSLRDQWKAAGALTRRLLSAALRQHDHVIGVSPEVTEDILRAGVPPERVSTLPAYVPPVVTPEARAALPARVWEFIAAHAPAMSFTSSIVRYQGQDLYGHDLALALVGRLRREGLNAGLVISLCRWDAQDESLRREIWERMEQPDVRGHVLVVEPGFELWPVLERVQVFVRPTRADGWGVSVAEAVTLGTPAVASDVCRRVSGAYLFRSGDLDDLVAQVRRALAEGVPPGSGAELTYHQTLIDLYEGLARR